MSCITKIKNCHSFTNNEKQIANFILQDSKAILFDTAQELANRLNTSAAAIIRFSKKLGYTSFNDLKIDLALDQHINETNVDLSELIKEKEPLESMVSKSKQSDLHAIEDVYDLLNIDTLQKSIQLLQQAKRIYLYGVGASYLCCYDFAQKLTRIGIDVVSFQDTHMQGATTASITKEDVVVAISYSGNTREVIVPVTYAKEVGTPVIAITQLSKNELHKYADALLFIPQKEKDLRFGAVLSRNSTFVLTDLLYLGIIKDNLSEYKEKLVASRALVMKLRK